MNRSKSHFPSHVTYAYENNRFPNATQSHKDKALGWTAHSDALNSDSRLIKHRSAAS